MRHPLPRATDDVVLIRGHRIRIRVYGEGPALLLLNGLTRPLESWEPATRQLRDRTVISFDAPGVGGSRTPLLPLSIPTLARLAGGVLDWVGVDRADILGFSFGGAVAQQFAVDSPARTRRLILVSTSCGVGATQGIADPWRALVPIAGSASWPRPDLVGTLWHFLAITQWSSVPFLGAIRTPTMVVCGVHDRVVPPSNSTVLAQRIRGAELVLLPAGHDVQRAGPARLLVDAVEPFLAAREPQLRTA